MKVATNEGTIFGSDFNYSQDIPIWARLDVLIQGLAVMEDKLREAKL